MKYAVVLIMLCLIPFAYADYGNLSEDVVGHYFYNSSILDNSPNGNDLSLSSVGVNKTVYHVGNMSAHFVGASTSQAYMPAGTRTTFDAGENFTISCWLYYESYTADDRVWSKDYTSHATPYYQISADLQNSASYLRVWSSTFTPYLVVPGPKIGARAWTMITGVYEELGGQNPTLKYYLNGTLIGTNTSENDAYTNHATDMYFGSQKNQGDWTLNNANLDNCVVYNRSLQPNEVNLLYNSGLGCDPFTSCNPVSFDFDDCSLYPYSYIDVSIRQENNPGQPLNASLDVGITYWPRTNASDTSTIGLNFSSGSEHSICGSFEAGDYLADVYFRNSVVGGFTHRHYLINESFNSTGIGVTLYNYNDTTGMSDFKGELRNINDYSLYKNIVTSLQRLYIPDGSIWRTVQMDESDDFGKIFFNIREEDTDYRLRFVRRSDQVILKTTDRLKFVCDAGVCSFTIELSPGVSEGSTHNLITNVTYHPDDANITIEWDDPSGITSSVSWYVTKQTLARSTLLCERTQSGSAGETWCDVSGITGSIYVRGWASSSPASPFHLDIIEINTTKLYNILSSEGYSDDAGLFAALIIIVLVMGATVLSTVAGLVALFAGIIIVSWLGILPVLGTSILTTICIIIFLVAAYIAGRGS